MYKTDNDFGIWLGQEIKCPHCGMEDSLYLTADGSGHDKTLLDLIIVCQESEDGCGAQFNAFVPISAFRRLEGV